MNSAAAEKPEFAETIGISESQYVHPPQGVEPLDYPARDDCREIAHSIIHIARRRRARREKTVGLKNDCAYRARRRQKCEESGLDRIVFAKKIGVSVPQFYIMLDGRSSPMLLVADAACDARGCNPVAIVGVSPIAKKR